MPVLYIFYYLLKALVFNTLPYYALCVVKISKGITV